MRRLPSRDLVLMADQHQMLNYRELAQEYVHSASRLAQGGDEAGATDVLQEAVEYHRIADEAEARSHTSPPLH